MCTALAEGGLRCAAHTRPRYAAAAPGTPEWEEAAAEYAATRTGRSELSDDRDHAWKVGAHEAAAAFTVALERGANRRAAARQVRDARRTQQGTLRLPPLPAQTVHGQDLPAVAFCSTFAYDPAAFNPVVNTGWNKPTGGLWLSPIIGTRDDGTYDTAWTDWAQQAQYAPAKSPRHIQHVQIAPGARVLRIDTVEDFSAVAATYPAPDVGGAAGYSARGIGFDYEAISEDYAVLWLTADGQQAVADTKPGLSGWDLETVLVLNGDVIRVSPARQTVQRTA